MSFLTDHLHEVGESYSIAMLLGGLACLVHAVLPFLFVRTASNRIQYLHDAMAKRRASSRPADPESSLEDAVPPAKSAPSGA